MQTLIQGLRYGVRILMKQPGFTLIAIITLAVVNFSPQGLKVITKAAVLNQWCLI